MISQVRTAASGEQIRTQAEEPSGTGGTLIWGAGAPVGNNDGQFANPFVQATSFAQGANPTSWTALSINQSGGSVTPGSAFWTRSLTGRSQGFFAPPTIISSPSQPNGAAIFDSDFLDSNGTAAAGSGSSPAPHRGELISPRIDLTGYANTALRVKFYSFFREFNVDKLSVAISVDDGATWSADVDYRSGNGNLVQGFAAVNFIGVTNGVADLSRARIKLIFDGDFFFAIVDDLSLEVAPPYDLALGVVSSANSASAAERGDVVHFTSNRYFPISQLNTSNLAFGANIRNLGAASVLPAQNPSLQLKIERNIGGTWTSAFTQSQAVGVTIPAAMLST